MTLSGLFEAIRDCRVARGMAPPSPPTIGPARPGDIVVSTADTALAAQELGFTVRNDLSDGPARTMDFHAAG